MISYLVLLLYVDPGEPFVFWSTIYQEVFG